MKGTETSPRLPDTPWRRLEHEVEAMTHEVYRLSWRAWVGEGPEVEIVSMLRRYPLIADARVLRQGREELEKAPDRQDYQEKLRLLFAAISFFLQGRLAPLTGHIGRLMLGASAVVGEEKIPYNQVVPWAQLQPDLTKRQRLYDDMIPLFRFLRPLYERMWQEVDELLRREFGYNGYSEYCQYKMGWDYEGLSRAVTDFLKATDPPYWEAMDEWALSDLEKPLASCNRYDALYLLTLKADVPWSHGRDLVQRIERGLKRVGLTLAKHPYIHMDIDERPGKQAQAMCFGVRVPQEVYLATSPVSGWMDAETLLHEAGHALHLAYIDPSLPFSFRHLPRSLVPLEASAFLVQNLLNFDVWLVEVLGFSAREASRLRRLKMLKDLSVMRRHAAKFLSEWAFFHGKIENPMAVYAEHLKTYTGFSYPPEGFFFDLDPEFYSADYLLAWAAEARWAEQLSSSGSDNRDGAGWVTSRETAAHLKSVWTGGDRTTLLDTLGRDRDFDFSALIRRYAESTPKQC